MKVILRHAFALTSTNPRWATTNRSMSFIHFSHLDTDKQGDTGKHGEDNTHSQPHACVCPTPCSPTSDADGGDRPCAPKVTTPHRNRDSLQFTSRVKGRVQFAQRIGQQNGKLSKKKCLLCLSTPPNPITCYGSQTAKQNVALSLHRCHRHFHHFHSVCMDSESRMDRMARP